MYSFFGMQGSKIQIFFIYVHLSYLVRQERCVIFSLKYVSLWLFWIDGLGQNRLKIEHCRLAFQRYHVYESLTNLCSSVKCKFCRNWLLTSFKYQKNEILFSLKKDGSENNRAFQQVPFFWIHQTTSEWPSKWRKMWLFRLGKCFPAM